LLDQARESQVRPVATLHGDLHAKNVLFTRGSAALIDLDNLCAGDPVRDLGSFVASTCARSLTREIAEPDIAPMISALVRSYEDDVPWEVPRLALRWYTAASLVSEQAHRTVIRMKNGSLHALIDLAEQALAGEGMMKVLS
jgi:thiamine kinase-like enzyme